MDLRQLRSFLVVARQQNVTRAAEELGVTQPALSRSIRELERDLNVELFTRVGRGIVITSAGKQLVDHANHIFRTVEQARDAVVAEGNTPQGMVAIGAPPSVGNIFFSTLIERYRALYPNVIVRALTGMTHTLVDWLRSGAIDLGVISIPPEFPQSLNLRDLECTPITREDMYVFAPRGENSLPEDMDIEQLAPYPLVLKDPSNMARQAIELAARMRGLKLNVVVEVENQVVLRHLVERGTGFGVVPGSALVDDVHRFRIAHLKGVSLDRLLARATGRPNTRAVSELNRLSLLVLDELKAKGVFDSDMLRSKRRPPFHKVRSARKPVVIAN
jgi:LysR family nitrogen assimilation transcriptional regulator